MFPEFETPRLEVPRWRLNLFFFTVDTVAEKGVVGFIFKRKKKNSVPPYAIANKYDPARSARALGASPRHGGGGRGAEGGQGG